MRFDRSDFPLASSPSGRYLAFMSAGKFDVSYSALAQMALLHPSDKDALERLFSSDERDLLKVSHRTADGRFVSRLGKKRVLWQRSSNQRPEIVSIIDRSYAGQ